MSGIRGNTPGRVTRSGARTEREREETPATSEPGERYREESPTHSETRASNPLFDFTEIDRLGATIGAAIAQANRRSKPSEKLLKPSDLPVFKGDTLDGADAEVFIDKLETAFRLAHTRSENKVATASQAFPEKSTAQTWYHEQKLAGAFREEDDDEYVLNYTLFRDAFAQRFATPLSRRYQIEDTWDRFIQKSPVKEHYTKFCRVLAQLNHLGIHHSDDVVASKYLRSLKPELFHIICTKNDDLPTFATVHAQAIEAEYQIQKSSRVPQFKGIFPNLNHQGNKDNNKTDNPKPSGNKKFYCLIHKENDSHETKDCRRIKHLKEAGEWKDRKKD
jgi:hypothetical protein